MEISLQHQALRARFLREFMENRSRPEPERLIEFKRMIEQETPGAQVTISTRAGDLVSDCDLIITATSAFGQRIVDITKCKPGAVICDVARPPDISEQEAALRPDVLVIESGEVIIPGDINITYDIGLPPKTAYPVSDLELASRLSFFLWSSIPDDELLTLAERGELRRPEVLARQAEIAQMEHDFGHAAGQKDAHGRMADGAVGQHIDQARHRGVDAAPVGDGGQRKAGSVGDSGDVEQQVGAAPKRGVDDHGVVQRVGAEDVAGRQARLLQRGERLRLQVHVRTIKKMFPVLAQLLAQVPSGWRVWRWRPTSL